MAAPGGTTPLAAAPSVVERAVAAAASGDPEGEGLPDVDRLSVAVGAGVAAVAGGGGPWGGSVASCCDEACGETCCDEPEPVAVAAEGGGREGSVGWGGTLPVADGATGGIILFGPVVPSEGFVEAAGGWLLLEEGVEGGIPLGGAGTGGWPCGLTDGEEPGTVAGGAAAELGGAAVAADAAGTPGTPGPPAVDGVGGCL